MRPANILAGAAFKSALLSLTVFCVVLAGAGVVIVQLVERSMRAELSAQIAEEVVLFQKIVQDQGPEALVQTIDALSRLKVAGDRIVGVFAPGGDRLAGNLALAPDFLGWGAVTDARDGFEVRADVLSLQGRTIAVGRSTRQIAKTRAALIQALLLAGAGVIAASMLIGGVISRNVFGKLEAMAATMDAVSRGDSGARLAISPARDQIDQVSARINQHLDRLAAFTAATRNTIVAIAHDLRTPLNRAYLHVQSAAEATDPAARTASLAEAAGEMEGISTTFDTILRIARIAGSDDRDSFRPLDAGRLMAELAETYDPVFESAGQRLTLVPAPQAWLMGDARMLWQLLVNLVENASRHCPPGTQVTLAGRAGPAGAVLEVADTGPGIPADQRAAAMQPFRQLDGLGGVHGAGLGLALVRAIVERHRARLELADNAPGLIVRVHFPPV